MSDFEVTSWAQPVPVADGTCHCGKAIKYNFREGIIAHVDPTVAATCMEPWPDVPNPVAWALSRQAAKTFGQLVEAMDRVALQEQSWTATDHVMADAIERAGSGEVTR